MYIIDEGKTLCTVKTGGKSVWDDDARWTFLSFSTHTDLVGKGDLYCSMSSARVLESESKQKFYLQRYENCDN